MNISIRHLIRYAAIACCCALIVDARAQDAGGENAPSPDNQTQQTRPQDAPAQDAPAEDAGPTPSTLAAPEDAPWTPRRRFHGHAMRPTGNGNDIVTVGGNSMLAKGEKADSVVSIFGSSTSDGEVADAVVSVFGDSRVTGPVGDSVVAVLGNVYLNSRIKGDVVAVLGSIELGPEADVGGDVVGIGGTVNRDVAAVVHGGVQKILTGVLGGFEWVRPWIEHCLLYGRPLALAPGLGWAWGLALGFLAFYVFLALLFRGAVDQCVATLEARPGHSILAALLTMLLTPVLFVLLCITIVGIAAVPFLVVGLFCAGLFGKVVILAALGRRCTTSLGAAGPLAHTALAVVVGGVIVLALYLIPVVGFIVYKLLGILGLGVVIYTLILAAQASKRAHPTAAPEADATSPPPSSPTASGFAADNAAVGMAAGDAASPGVPPPAMQSRSSAEMHSSDEVHASAEAHSPGEARASAQRPSPTAAPALAASTLPRAGFWIRMGALLLDAVLIGIVLSLLHNSTKVELLALATYGAVMWKLKGTTIGGIVCGLLVVRLDGRPIDWATAIVRALGCFLSLAVAGLGFLWIVFDDGHQAWHDKIAGTVVVRVPKGVSLL
jgi:uncharacterized RDD family membrane protein YckC